MLDNSSEINRAHDVTVALVAAADEFDVYCDKLTAFVRTGEGEAELREARGPLTRVGRARKWTASALVKALRQNGCHPIELTAEEAGRYATAMDLLMYGCFHEHP